ncbi:MAG: hypothetical protein VB055_10315 [Oscillospiraceae bacterium]|nr:hypothetical protein [Oscillospiraceae bacterium]
MKKMRLLLLLILLLTAAAVLLPRAAQDLRRQSTGAIRQAVLQSAAQCYAVEGVYPETLSYLEEHYGLVVNHRRYIVTYDAFSSNLPPDVAVLVRGEEGSGAS